MTMIRKAGAEGPEESGQINVDLATTPAASAKDWIGSAESQKSLLREINAGTIAKIIAGTVMCLLLMPLIIAGFIIAFKSAEQAQAYASIVGTLLRSTGEFISSAFLPILSSVLIYYFLRERKDKPHK